MKSSQPLRSGTTQSLKQMSTSARLVMGEVQMWTVVMRTLEKCQWTTFLLTSSGVRQKLKYVVLMVPHGVWDRPFSNLMLQLNR